MIELNIQGKKIMSIEDDNTTIIFDKKIANDVKCDIEGKEITIEISDHK